MFKVDDKVRITDNFYGMSYYISDELRAGNTGIVVIPAFSDEGDPRVGVVMDSGFSPNPDVADDWRYPTDYLELIVEGEV